VEPAVFFDGQSSRRRVVALAFTERLEITEPGEGESAGIASWPYDQVRRVDGPEDALRLACTAAPPLARLELRDPTARAEILRRCPALDGPGSATAVSVRRIAVASLAAAVAIVGMIWFGMPLLANRLAEITPYSWEKPLGEAVDPRVRAIFAPPASGRKAPRRCITWSDGCKRRPNCRSRPNLQCSDRPCRTPSRCRAAGFTSYPGCLRRPRARTSSPACWRMSSAMSSAGTGCAG
jgi:hypothetical protein